MPETPDDLDVVQVIKQEWVSLGGGSTSPYSVPIEPLEDGVEVGAVFLVESGRRNKALAIWSDNGNLRIRDVFNPGTDSKGFTLTELLAGVGGITINSHKALLQLIHFIDEGPAESFTTGATKTVTGTVFPTQELWKRADTTKLVEKNITWTGVNPTTVEWKMYDTDGIAVLATVTDTVAYSGVFLTGRVRAIA